MPTVQIKQPTKLEYLAIKNLSNWITSQAETVIDLHAKNPTQAEEMLSKQIEITQNYIQSNLPGAFHDKLVEKVIESLSLLFDEEKWSLAQRQKNYVEIYRWQVFGRMIETVLSKNVTVLLLPDPIWEIIEASIESKCDDLTGLEHVALPRGLKESLYVKLFEKLHCLRRLWTCPANMLNCMVQNCKLVEELILSDCDLADNDIDILIELPNLRKVDLYENRRVTEKGIEKLLLSCENIERIYPCKDIPKILERFSIQKANSEKQFKLNFYDNYYETSLEQLQVFTKHCPFTAKVNLDKIKYTGDQNYLEPLKQLLHLRELKLTHFKFYTNGVNEVLKARGCNLSHLELWHTGEMDLHSLKYICKMCPRLQNLLLCCSDFVKKSFTLQKFTNEIEMPPLKYLKRFKLRITHRSLPTPEQLQFLLTNCQNVEFIEIMNNTESVLQDSMMSVLDKNPNNFMNLKKLVTNEYLSMLVINGIVQNCIYPPEIIAVSTETSSQQRPYPLRGSGRQVFARPFVPREKYVLQK